MGELSRKTFVTVGPFQVDIATKMGAAISDLG